MDKSNIAYLLMLPRFEYSAPGTVGEVCSLLSENKGKAKILAGGTDLLVSMKKRNESPKHLIGISAVSELDYIRYDHENGLKIGALATLQSIASSTVVKNTFEVLAKSCRKVGTPQIRNMGTLAGNICQAGPSQDTIPALLVLEAKVKLLSSDGERVVPIDEFFVGPFQSVLRDHELLTEIQVPPPPTQSAASWQWLPKGTEVDETLVGVAVLIVAHSSGEVCDDIKIGLTSVAPTPMRARRAEEVLRGNRIEEKLVEKVARVAAEETMPRSRADYRRRMASVLVKRAVHEAWQSLKKA
jgi:CO/xanthine dehydrogenase FAD-binding subunit